MNNIISYETAYEKVSHIIIDRFGIDEDKVSPQLHFKEDLGADSLDVVELIMELEESFGLQIDDEEAEKIITIENAVNYIVARGQ